jgi:DNA-binding CsgD family transcriptional regulator
MTDERIIKLYEQGKSFAAIAKIAKCKEHEINNRLVALRAEGRVGVRDLRGGGGGESATEAKEKRKEKVLAMRLAGKTNAQIAKKLTITDAHARSLASELIAEGKLEKRVNRFA